MWQERTFGNKGEGQDYSRADVLGYAVWAWPADEKVRSWLAVKWTSWEREQPKFFTEKWIKRIRREVSPNHPRLFCPSISLTTGMTLEI